MTKAPLCEAEGCFYEHSGFPRCSGGCVESGTSEGLSGFGTGYGAAFALAMAGPAGYTGPRAARLVSSTDSASAAEDHRAQQDLTSNYDWTRSTFERKSTPVWPGMPYYFGGP